MNKSFSSLFAACATLLASCGGGGSEAISEPVLGFPVASVLTQLATNGQKFSGKYAPAPGVLKSVLVTYAPSGLDQFRREQAVTIDGVESQLTQQGDITLEFESGGIFVKAWSNDLGIFSGFSVGSNNHLPTRANVGASGMLAEVKIRDASGTGFDSRSLTWTLTSASITTAEFCLGYNYGSIWGGGTTTDCFLINEIGAIIGFKNKSIFSVAHVSGNELYQ